MQICDYFVQSLAAIGSWLPVNPTIFFAYAVRLFVVYATVSFLENMSHRFLMHSPKLARIFGSAYLMECFEDHRNHHFACYDVFDHEEGSCGLKNLSIKLSTELISVAIPAAVAFYFDWRTTVIFVVAAILHGLLWSAVHTEMHRKQGTWFSRTWFFQALCRHHYLHHRHPGTNYNGLFLGWDLVLRTTARMTGEDHELMQQEHWVVFPKKVARRAATVPA